MDHDGGHVPESRDGIGELVEELAQPVRARQLAQGGSPMIEANRDKPTVIALREMALGKYGVEYLSRVNSG